MQLKNSFFNVIGRDEVDGKYSCTIELNPDHFIFMAHFPGNPIVPGVCQVQMVSELLAEKLGREVYLREVKNIKYLAVMTPSEQIVYDVAFQKIAAGEDECKVVLTYADKEKPYAKFSLTYGYNKI